MQFLNSLLEAEALLHICHNQCLKQMCDPPPLHLM